MSPDARGRDDDDRQGGAVPEGSRQEADRSDSDRRGDDRPGTSPTEAGGYTDEHAVAGLDAELPELDTFPNQYRGYVITNEYPEYTSVCPKTGLPDYGKITLRYEPDERVVELKSLKLYLLAYRDLGIFYENAVNRILDDVVEACDPVWAELTGEFTPRGGLSTTVVAFYDRDDADREEGPEDD